MTKLVKNKTLTVDAVVPCFNEAPRVGAVLRALNESKHIKKIIFVDDGSKDGSSEVAKKFSKVRLIRNKVNQGQGNSIKIGLEYVTTEAVMLCDADLCGFDQRHVAKMVKAFYRNPRSMVVGMKEKNPQIYHWFQYNVGPLIPGERILLTTTLKEILSSPISTEYGHVIYMNYYFHLKRRPIVKVLLRGVDDVFKLNKEAHGIKPLVEEVMNMGEKYFQVYAKQMPKDIYNHIRSLI